MDLYIRSSVCFMTDIYITEIYERKGSEFWYIVTGDSMPETHVSINHCQNKGQLKCDLYNECQWNALAPQRCEPGSLSGVGMSGNHVATRLDMLVSSGHSDFLSHEDHAIANIDVHENECTGSNTMYALFRNCCKTNKA